MLRPLALALLLLAAADASAAAQERADTVRGRVVDAAGAPVARAEVSVRSARTLVLRTTLTGADGRWRVTFPAPSDAYEVSVRRIGKAPARLRAVRLGPGPVDAPDAVLADLPLALEGITASGRRPPPVMSGPGGDRLPHEPSAAQTWDPGDETRLSRGELDASAALAPGATVLDDGRVSVGGLAPGQNAFRLNGLSFGGARIPELAGLHGYATTQTADASRGGFGGGEVTVGLMTGHYQDPQLSLRLFSSEPALQLAGPAGGPAPRYREGRASAAFLAGLLGQRASLSVAADVQRRTTPVVTALSGDASLRAAGVAPDSLARLTAILASLGVPAAAGGVPGRQSLEQANVLATLGIHRLLPGVEGTAHLQADRARRSPLGLAPTVLPSAGGRADEGGINAGAQLQALTRGGFLHEAGLVFDRRARRSSPYLALPGAAVRIASDLGEGGAALSSLRFGGRGGAARAETSFWEGRWQLRWKTLDERHQRTAGVEAGTYAHRETSEGDRLGTFVFGSLADLQAGRPASFTRSLGVLEGDARVWSGALYAENLFRPSERVEVRMGARVEGALPAGVGARSREAEAAFGGRTGRVPGEVALVPRFGFSWRSAPGLAGRGRPPFGALSGALTLERDWLDPAAELGRALPGGAARVLRCAGDAAPAPEWPAYMDDPAAIPDACLAGATGSADAAAGAAPGVALYDDGYRAPRAWKASLRWSGRVPVPSPTPGGVRLSLEALRVRGTHQPSVRDANLLADPRFTLADEGGRPVFAPASAFDPRTGAVALEPSRRLGAFGRAMELRSDGATDTWSLTVGVSPHRVDHHRPRYSLAYTWSRGRTRERGFDGAGTAGDPAALAWARSTRVAEHALHGFVDVPVRGGLSLRLAGRAQSGLPYTPLVLGDVNGDGDAFNDAAFVFDPARTADPALAEGMRALLAGARGATRRCLERSLGRAALPASCAGAWTASLDAELVASVPTPSGRGGALIVRARNLPGGLDHLLHGASGRRGWGDRAAVDPVLLSARGFDPVGRRFLYDVNGRFGAGAAAARPRTPFVVEVVASVTVGRSHPHVAVSQLAHALRADAPTAADSSRELAFWLRTPVNPAGHLVRHSADALLLTPAQARALEAIEAAFDSQAAALVAEPLRYLRGALGRQPDAGVARALEPARARYEALHTAALRCVRRVLGDDQWLLVHPEWAHRLRARPAPGEPRLACPQPESGSGEAEAEAEMKMDTEKTMGVDGPEKSSETEKPDG